MAKFEVVEQEGMRFVKIGLADETVRVQRPSSPAPARWATGWRDPPKSLLKTYISGESYCRTYDGPGRLQVTWVPYWQFRLLGPQPSPRSTAAAARLRLRSRLMPGPFLTGPFGWNGADSRGGVSKYHLGKSVELPISTAGADLPGSRAV
jgi:hypothetical protein